ncbi:Pls/PosA family non-ribosomal peptide synthetase [Allokutzneria sp. NRRL B-24872]|uniref:Pls/PosA family non-ribosomal peptide synthetase n=1 Tax=Allokutzneria sp. NRRL B-24872 TaxID=1137961 RepID=UPI000A38B45C|nr:Pls/PosA family non-ribosomal peptide synthetase [Allokutzneria sp. NRRL B-24872]
MTSGLAAQLSTARETTPMGSATYPAADPPSQRTLVDIFHTTVAAQPCAPALDDGATTLSYSDLAKWVGEVVTTWRAAGIGLGDRVGIRLPSGTAELYVSILATLSVGAAYVPVDFDDPVERAEMIWQEAEVCAVAGPGGEVRKLRETARRRPIRPPAPENDAWVIFTSGSTGKPKGVAVTHRSAAAFVDAEAELFLPDDPLGPADRVLAGLSVGFDASCEEMWLAWRHGACLVPAPRELVRAGAELGPWLAERGITVVSTVPTLAGLWPADVLGGVRLVILGGEATSQELAAKLDVPGREVWNTYGPTETTVVASAARVSADLPVRIGFPLAGWELAVVGPSGEPVAWGETGELVIGGVGLARYLDVAKDREKFAPLPSLGWGRAYRSGDVVRADPEGLVFVGRSDDQVKIGGRRVELGEVDAALAALPGVSTAASVVRKTETGAPVLVGYLVLNDTESTLDIVAARLQLAERLPSALVPLLAVVPTMPIRASGKVDRDALPWPLEEASISEWSEAEAIIAEHWSAVLGQTPAEDSDFFSSGGGSLAVAHLVSRLREHFPQASVADIYQHPTVRGLAEKLADESGAPQADNRMRSVKPGSFALFGFAQSLFALVVFAVAGLRLLLVVVAFQELSALAGIPGISSTVPWYWLGLAWLLFFTSPGRVLLAAAGARLATAGIRPGEHRRAGWNHLRLWAAERWVTAVGVASITGTFWVLHYARALGCRVGQNVDLHALPPVTGLATFGDRAAVEQDSDLAGWWLDSDCVRVGGIDVGAGSRIGGHSTLLDGAVVEDGAEVLSGSSVRGTVSAGHQWGGAPARDLGEVDEAWPESPARRSLVWRTIYGLTPLLTGVIVLLSAFPGLLVLGSLVTSAMTVATAAWVVPLAALGSLVTYAGSTVLVVRLLNFAVKPGVHRVDSLAGWSAWLVQRFTTGARGTLFSLYAGLLTSTWLRMLGAKIGRGTEVSTVAGLPSMMAVGSGSFLADDTSLAPYELRNGWLAVGTARVGDRTFIGNSAEVGHGRWVPDGSLLGVLSSAPKRVPENTSWLGRPAMLLPRKVEGGSTARTYDPPRRLVVARMLIETCRLLPVMVSYGLALFTVVLLSFLLTSQGIVAAALAASWLTPAAAVVAVAVAIAAKWVLVGKHVPRERPLWSSFVWRNELAAVFFEELVTRWAGTALIGTPLFSMVLRGMGAKIGRGVHCETRWLPEPDLVTLGDGAVVNRGCVVQTHLFHDRIMRLGPIHIGRGATVGPRSVVLFDSTVGAHGSVGANSLVMRGESLPEGTAWMGNPVAAEIRPARTVAARTVAARTEGTAR